MSFLFINKTLWCNNLNTRTSINAKISVSLFVLKRSYICYYIISMTVPLILEASNSKSEPCLPWCSWVLSKWRHNVLNLLRDHTRPAHWGVMRIYGWELLVVCHQPDNLIDYKRCDSKDIIIFLICQVTSRDHRFQGLCEFMGGSQSP